MKQLASSLHAVRNLQQVCYQAGASDANASGYRLGDRSRLAATCAFLAVYDDYSMLRQKPKPRKNFRCASESGSVDETVPSAVIPDRLSKIRAIFVHWTRPAFRRPVIAPGRTSAALDGIRFN